MQPRTVALVGLLSLGLGWALGGRAPLFSGDVRPEARAPGGPPRPLGAGANYTPPEPVRLSAAKPPRAPRPMRNPFTTVERRSVPAPRREPVEEAAAENRAPVALPAAPVLRLTGMATTAGPEGPEFTAMINDGQALVFARLGDTVAGFVVVRVEETSVTLRDSAGGERTLRLR